MFDPIKVQEGQQQSGDKAEPAVTAQGRKSSIMASHRSSSVNSPLIKGLPTPVFAVPKPVKPVLRTVEVQTDPPAEKPTAPAAPVQEEVS